MRQVMIETFIAGAERGIEVAVVVGDSTSTSKIQPFMQRYPQRVINVGIAEQNLVGVAAGLSMGGMVAFTCNAAPFLVARANEQIKNDICYSNTNVKLVGLNAGVAYGPLGSTHHAIDDIAVMRGFGNISIFAPADPVEAKAVFEYALEHVGPMYIRMDSAALAALHESDYAFEPGKVDVLAEGRDVTICALGTIAHEAVGAARVLQADGIEAEILSLSSIRPIDRPALIESVRKTGRVLTVEEHALAGGIGSLVAETLMEAGVVARMQRLGFPEGEFPKAGPRKSMRAHYSLDCNGIAAMARALCREQRGRAA
ncbi:MAG: transketolase family protein [Chitinivibrionales bacterium]|nr:transketolase family protein [Chitinivibrionales bacterium]